MSGDRPWFCGRATAHCQLRVATLAVTIADPKPRASDVKANPSPRMARHPGVVDEELLPRSQPWACTPVDIRWKYGPKILTFSHFSARPA